MNAEQAVKLAIVCIDKEIKKIIFDANLYERFGAPHGERAWMRLQRLEEARKILMRSILVTQGTFTFDEEETI